MGVWLHSDDKEPRLVEMDCTMKSEYLCRHPAGQFRKISINRLFQFHFDLTLAHFHAADLAKQFWVHVHERKRLTGNADSILVGEDSVLDCARLCRQV